MADEIIGRRSEVVVDVWNKALSRIGQNEDIEDEGEDRLAARECRKHYHDCLEEALAARDWSFARRQAVPSLLGVTRVGWAYAYQLPPDFVAPRAILSGGVRHSLTPSESRIPYELQDNDDDSGLLFCTDYEFTTEDTLEYTTRHQVVAAWPRLFLSAVAWRLSAELALSIIKGVEGERMAGVRFDTFAVVLAQAFSADLNSKTPDQPLPAESIRARQGA